MRARFRHELADFRLDVAIETPDAGITVVFGPSGAGKTTLLRLIAGLDRPREGFLAIGDETWQDESCFVPAHRRAVGYVFQETSLFPHLSVRGNLEYGWRRVDAEDRRIPFDRVVGLLAIGGILVRDPASLSGGERRRVAMARALLTSPRLLLMDEPLAGLDPLRRTEILPYLEEVAATTATPILYVTHSPNEALRLADHIVVLEGGRVTASGPIDALAHRLDLDWAQEAETVDAEVVGHDETFRLTVLAVGDGRISVPHEPLEIGRRVRVRIHARDVSVALAPEVRTTLLDLLPARIVALEERGPVMVTARLDAGGALLSAHLSRRAVSELGLRPDMDVWAQIRSATVIVGD